MSRHKIPAKINEKGSERPLPFSTYIEFKSFAGTTHRFPFKTSDGN